MNIGRDGGACAREPKVRCQYADLARGDLREINAAVGVGEAVHQPESFAEDADVCAADERMRIGGVDIRTPNGDAHGPRAGERPQLDDQILPQQFAG